MTVSLGSAITLPLGMSDCGVDAPLRIWSRTGTSGDCHAFPLMVSCRVAPLCKAVSSDQWHPVREGRAHKTEGKVDLLECCRVGGVEVRRARLDRQ